MKTINHIIPKIFFVMIFISVFLAGCVQPINLGLMETGKNSKAQEFYVANYKMKVSVMPITDDYQYICSISLSDKDNSTSIKDVKSNMDIKKYSSHSTPRGGIQRTKQVIINDIEPIKDSLSNDFEYKLKSKGKYELTIKLTHIEGKELEKEILVSFDQEVK
ncbi:MAG: hypothetical protein AB1432_00345 [Bacteroidota bacterium]